MHKIRCRSGASVLFKHQNEDNLISVTFVHNSLYNVHTIVWGESKKHSVSSSSVDEKALLERERTEWSDEFELQRIYNNSNNHFL